MARAQRPDTFIRDFCSTGSWRLLPLLLLYIVGFAVLAPIVPTLMTNFMASRRAGYSLVCEEYPPTKQPPECQDAYSDVVFWSSASSFISNGLTFVLSPLVGRWSDARGRKPFMVIAMVFSVLPACVLVMYLYLGTSLLWYYPAQALGGGVSMISLSLAYVADLLLPSHRASAFGTIMASFSLGILIGPAIGAFLNPLVAASIAAGSGAVCMLFIVFLLPESLSQEASEASRARQASADRSISNWMGMRILMRSSLFKRLTLCVMITGIASDGVYDLLFQYLKLKLGFTTKDLTLVFELYGILGLLVQTVVLRVMLRAVGEVYVLLTGLCFETMRLLLLGFAQAKYQAFLSIVFATMGGLSFPAISSIKANNVAAHEQGEIQGALYGARALAVACAPISSAILFALFSREDSPLPYFPGAPFLFFASLVAVAVMVAATIHTDAGKGHAHMAPLFGDDPEADGEDSAACQHLAGLPLPAVDARAGGDGAELLDGLLAKGSKQAADGDA